MLCSFKNLFISNSTCICIHIVHMFKSLSNCRESVFYSFPTEGVFCNCCSFLFPELKVGENTNKLTCFFTNLSATFFCSFCYSLCCYNLSYFSSNFWCYLWYNFGSNIKVILHLFLHHNRYSNLFLYLYTTSYILKQYIILLHHYAKPTWDTFQRCSNQQVRQMHQSNRYANFWLCLCWPY